MLPDVILGTATVLMALLGAGLSLHPPESLHDPRKWYVKACYAAAFAVLGVVALIYVIKQSKETAVANQKLSNAVVNLSNSTSEISRVTSLNTALQQKLLDQSTRISTLAEESFKNITGSDSFPYVAPQPSTYPGPVPLFVWGHGKYMLNGVTIAIRKSDDFNYYHQPIDIGVLHPGWGKPLGVAIQPTPDAKTGADIYIVEMYTQMGFFTEVIHFRKSHDGRSWAFKFWVQTTKFGPRTEKKTPQPKLSKLKANQNVSYTIYDRSQWSDEPQN